jgi:heat-inducible transcriptional repressor
MPLGDLSERERRVLEAVITAYVSTAEPAGSRAIAKRFGLGVSPATIRNTMSDLEEKGYLFHPHTSAGRVPTDKAYRLYVDALMRLDQPVSSNDRVWLARELAESGSAIETILRRAAESLGVVAQELGIALGPRLDEVRLRRLDLVPVAMDRLLMVLELEGGSVRTVFVEVPGEIASGALLEVARVLNERLAGLTLAEIRQSLAARLRDGAHTAEAAQLLNVFVQEGDQFFAMTAPGDGDVLLGQAGVLADQPEFANGARLRQLLALTDTRQHLADLLYSRRGTQGPTITIGNEHGDPRLEPFTVVTAEYRAGTLSGVIGVIGPTRMPYEKVVALVGHTSQLISEMLS